MRKCLFFLFGIWVGIGSAAQDGQDVVEEIEVVLRQVQVNVRDRDGAHVPGLGREDFQIKLNGKTQKIEVIEEISIDAAVNESDLSPNVSRFFIFFFDLRYANKAGLLKSRAAARDFVEKDITPADRVGVFTFEPTNGVNMVLAPTANRKRALDAIEWLGLADGQHLGALSARLDQPRAVFDQAEQDLADLYGTIPDSAGPAEQINLSNVTDPRVQVVFALNHFMDMARQADRVNDEIYERDVMSFLGSFKIFADSLRAVEGRKNLVWFSTGFDASALAGRSVQELVENSQAAEFGEYHKIDSDQYGTANIQQEASDVVEMLRGSDTLVFAVDTAQFAEGAAQRKGIQTLNLFARDTGGKVFERHGDLAEPLRRINELTNDYYLVSFKPEARLKPGSVGKLKVKVKRPKVNVYAVRGLSLDQRPRLLSPLTAQIQMQAFIEEDRVLDGVPLAMNHLSLPFNDDLVQLNVLVSTPGSYFLGGSDKLKRIEIFAFAMNRETEILADQSAFRFQLEPKRVEDILRETGLKYSGNLFLAPGEYRIKVVARDLSSGKVGSLWQDVSVARAEAGGLLGPIVMTDRRWVLMRDNTAPRKIQALAEGFSLAYPFQVGDYSLIPAEDAAASANGSGRFFFLLDGDFGGATPGVAAMLMDAEGKTTVIPASAMVGEFQARQGARKRLAFVLSVDFSKLGVNAGERYKLYTQFRAQTGKPLRAVAEVTLR